MTDDCPKCGKFHIPANSPCPDFADQEAERLVEIITPKSHWTYEEVEQVKAIALALRAAKRDAIIEFCEGEDSKMAEIERAAWEAGFRNGNVNPTAQEWREKGFSAGVEASARVCKEGRQPLVGVYDDPFVEGKYAMADTLERIILALKPEGNK